IDHDALAVTAPQRQAGRAHLFDDGGNAHVRDEIVAGDGNRDAVRVGADRGLTEHRGIERAPPSAVNEHRERRLAAAGSRENVDCLPGRRAVSDGQFGAGSRLAIGLGLTRPTRENLRVFGNAATVVVFLFIVDRRHGVFPAFALDAKAIRLCAAGKHRYLWDMKIDGKQTRSIWVERDGASIGIIDQTVLPHRFATLRLATLEAAARAIKSMQTRGAPLIGAVAAYGLWLALRADASDENLERAYAALLATRPTAINLKWALDE